MPGASESEMLDERSSSLPHRGFSNADSSHSPPPYAALERRLQLRSSRSFQKSFIAHGQAPAPTYTSPAYGIPPCCQ